MTRMYWSASLFAWTPPTVMRHHDFFVCFVLSLGTQNSPLLVNYANQAVTEKRPQALCFYPVDGYFLTYPETLRPDSWCT